MGYWTKFCNKRANERTKEKTNKQKNEQTNKRQFWTAKINNFKVFHPKKIPSRKKFIFLERCSKTQKGWSKSNLPLFLTGERFPFLKGFKTQLTNKNGVYQNTPQLSPDEQMKSLSFTSYYPALAKLMSSDSSSDRHKVSQGLQVLAGIRALPHGH